MMNRLMTAKEVSWKLRIHINTVKRIPTEELPFFRVSTRGDRRYRSEDVDAYLLAREVPRP